MLLWFHRVSGFCLTVCLLLACSPPRNARGADPADAAWQAGAAAVNVTPAEPMWMAGYASRNKPSEGVAQPLFAKALALQDATGIRVVFVTLDLIAVPRNLREFLEQEAEQKFKLPPSGLLLNCSHTHCGPELRVNRGYIYGAGEDRLRQSAAYMGELQQKLSALVGQALENLAPARVGYSHARCGFAMNRRLPTEKGYQNSPYPEGPVDHDVPVLRVDGPDGKLRPVLFGYACHNTTLSFYQFCGDYAGYAQEALEGEHPGAVALFLMGCGGDQNPYPRGKLEQAQQHGRALANAVEAALLPEARALRGPLAATYETVDLEFVTPPSRDELLKLRESNTEYDRRRAAALLHELDTAGAIRSAYPAPVQVIQFGGDLTLVALPGETVVDYSLRLKRELAGKPITWVAGYSNDVFAYIPSARVLNEGGYEARDAMRYTTMPGPFKDSVEERLAGKALELVRRLRAAK